MKARKKRLAVYSQTLLLVELDPRRCDTDTLVVGDDLDASTTVNAHTGVCSTQVDTNNRSVISIVVGASDRDEANESHNGKE